MFFVRTPYVLYVLYREGRLLKRWENKSLSRPSTVLCRWQIGAVLDTIKREAVRLMS